MRPQFRAKRIWMAGIFVFLGITLVIGQQCSRTPLTRDLAFSLSSNPFQMNAPGDYPIIRRYVILVDMSHSMISGPCPQDVDADIMFQSTPPYSPYDPNLGTGNSSDHRADGSDCQVNPALPIALSSVSLSPPNFTGNSPVSYQTALGSDYEGDRFTIVRTWINQIVSTSTPQTLANTQIMLYPFTGGTNQVQLTGPLGQAPPLTGACPMQPVFHQANDPALTDYLNCLQAQQWINLMLAESPMIYRYQPQNITMGTSSPGALISPIHEALNSDMYNLNEQGLLPFAQYRFIHLSDGMWTPLQAQEDLALQIFPECSACTSTSPGTCDANCATLVTNMKNTWGDPEDQDLTTLTFNYGKIQSLPQYYGNGFVDIDFVELKPERHQSYFPGQQTFYQQLLPLFQAKNRTASTWTAEGGQPPFDLSMNSDATTNFKVTNLYVLNTNARVDQNGNLKPDSDGDGLTDDLEAQYGTDPTKARTDGVCLDSLAVNPAFMARCKALAQSGQCDPTLDSDGDSLNECEEMVLGTNPFGFDTDGDTIPDSLEWIYGYNPLLSDAHLDSNGDGVPNLVNFAKGLSPTAAFNQLASNLLPNYVFNYLGKGSSTNPVFGQVWLEQYELMIYSIPTVSTLSVNESDQVPLYASRTSSDPSAAAINKIPASQQLISYSSQPQTNMLMILARMIDTNDPQRAYWRIFKMPIPVGGAIDQPVVDLSKFVQIRAIDLNSGTGQ